MVERIPVKSQSSLFFFLKTYNLNKTCPIKPGKGVASCEWWSLIRAISINDTLHKNWKSLCWVSLCWVSLCWVPLCWLSLCWVSLCWVSLCWVSLCWVSLCWVSLCWGSLCWVSCFSNCYPECRYAECLDVDCRGAQLTLLNLVALY